MYVEHDQWFTGNRVVTAPNTEFWFTAPASPIILIRWGIVLSGAPTTPEDLILAMDLRVTPQSDTNRQNNFGGQLNSDGLGIPASAINGDCFQHTLIQGEGISATDSTRKTGQVNPGEELVLEVIQGTGASGSMGLQVEYELLSGQGYDVDAALNGAFTEMAA